MAFGLRTRRNAAQEKKKGLWQIGGALLTVASALIARLVAGAEAFSPDMSDAELVRLCHERGMRDERPFQELFRRHQQTVYRACYSVVRNQRDAEDLTQDVFFKVYRSLPKFEGRSSFKTWIYSIAINTGRNELRRRSRRAQEAETDIHEMAEVLPSDDSLEKQVQSRLEVNYLQEALSALRDEEMQVLLMKDYEQQTYADIADAFGIGLSAAKMRVQRARLALQTKYQEVATEV